jgi:hypothetical protein
MPIVYTGDTASYKSGNDVVKDAETAYTHLVQVNSVLTWAYVQKKGGRIGTSSDEEQDLLRARLLLTSSGLDAVMKYLCYRAIPYMASQGDSKVISAMENHLVSILDGILKSPSKMDKKTAFVKIVLSDYPLEETVKDYVKLQFDGSMQSFDALTNAAKLLTIQQQFLISRKALLTEAFKARNNITHELDMDPFGTRRKRRQRKVKVIESYCRALKNVANEAIVHVRERVDSISREYEESI